MSEQWIDSVGIDVGTSTTKWIHTRLELKQQAAMAQLPQYAIGRRQVAYRSPMFSTPVTGDGGIDVKALAAILKEEYARAGLAPGQVETGAVIVTGETATRHNAEKVVQELALTAGQFVAASAGAELESLLAGIGSGAREHSRRRAGIVANVDIGGGTANIVYFANGTQIATAALHIGGRLVRVDGTGHVTYVSPAIRRWLDAVPGEGLPVVQAGESAGLEELRSLADRMAELLLGVLQGRSASLREAASLFIGPPPRELPVPDEIWVSGGVGALMAAKPPADLAEAARYGDIGPLLAEALTRISAGEPAQVRQAPEASRATVIGAGAFSTEIGGATMYAAPGLLPLRNVPVVTCRLETADEGHRPGGGMAEAVEPAAERGLLLYGEADSPPLFALALRSPAPCSYRQLSDLADAVAAMYTRQPFAVMPVVLVCQQDMAKALGYALLARLGESGARRLVCLDQLQPEEGDYLDIGAPLREDVVPVVVKSLIFAVSNGKEES